MTDARISEHASSTGDQRQAHRASMALRRAKLVCQSGEYLTVVRDVSELGVGLGFFHDVPPEPRTLLKLSSGLTYPVERVWTGKRQAGYRFGAEVTLNEFMTESSQHPPRPLRIQMSAPVRIGAGRGAYDARLLDLSCEGAKITCAGSIGTGRLLTFEIPGLPPQLAQARWSDGKHHGLKFQHPLSSEELARCALVNQPFETRRQGGFARLLAKARAA